MEAALNMIYDEDVLHNIDSLDSLDYILCRPRIYKTRRDYFEEYDDVDFSTRFRLSKNAVLRVLELIEGKLEYSSDR